MRKHWLKIVLFPCPFIVAVLMLMFFSGRAQNQNFPGNTLSASNVYVNGVPFPATAAGVQLAINYAETGAGSKETIQLPCGTTNISTTLSITFGGIKMVGCGSGMWDTAPPNVANAATRLLWTGATGSDLLQIQGAVSPNRVDKVVLQSIMLDCNGTCRYALRTQQTDTDSFYDIRIRNSAPTSVTATSALWYNVDSTGMDCFNCGFTEIGGYGVVWDGGTYQNAIYGGKFDQLVAQTGGASLVIQGVGGSDVIDGAEFNSNTSTALIGHVLITGFDTNSSFPSAPTGFAGAPNEITFNTILVNSNDAPSQGADILLTGTAANPSAYFLFENPSFAGLAATSTIAIRMDQTSRMLITGGQSNGHTAGTASTVDITANAGKSMLFGLITADTNLITGAGQSQLTVLNQGFNSVGAVFPSNFGTIGELNLAQAWTATQTQNLAEVAGGTKPTVTGTGTCATSDTPLGGLWAGSIRCTGSSGASTITFTFPTNAPNFYKCEAYDTTTLTDGLVHGTHANNSCVFSAAAMVANDLVVFSAVAY